MEFTHLGYGTNKRVVRVKGEDWVVAFSTGWGGTNKDVREETETLSTLASREIPVPLPFAPTRPVSDIVFETKVFYDGEVKTVCGFVQQFLPFVEMKKDPKPAKQKFATDVILAGGRVPGTIRTTLDDLGKIK